MDSVRPPCTTQGTLRTVDSWCREIVAAEAMISVPTLLAYHACRVHPLTMSDDEGNNRIVGFVNWMAIDDTFALGQMQGCVVTLVGRLGTGSVVDGSFPLFNTSAFSPRLPSSDAVNIVGVDGNEFTLTFTAPVQDLLFHLASLGSTLAFQNATAVQKVSGDETFNVSGTTISGELVGSTDSNGTARVPGIFTSLNFSVTPNFVGGSVVDGIYLQVGCVTPGGG